MVTIARQGGGCLYLPSFFCDEVVESLLAFDLGVRRYRCVPGAKDLPEFDQAPGADDVVMIINFFGVDDHRFWAPEIRAKFGAITLEDHTHDPASPWAESSQACYCFASLRKSLPVSDGALLWSPSGRPLPPPGERRHDDPSFVAAMALKQLYLAGEGESGLKQQFRSLQVNAHQRLDALPSPLGASRWTAIQLGGGFPSLWRERRAANAQDLVGRIPVALRQYLLFTTWRSEQCPFSIPLVLEHADARDALRRRLVSAGIYPPVHWLASGSPDPAARDLGQRILSLPVDQRYGEGEMQRTAQLLGEALRS